jgi:hypothetical protein
VARPVDRERRNVLVAVVVYCDVDTFGMGADPSVGSTPHRPGRAVA